MTALTSYLAHPLIAGVLAGLGAAVLVDYVEFRKWKSLNDAVSYDWGIAAFRWLQGAVGGLVTALGIQGVS